MKKLLNALGALLGAGVLALAALFAVNATDEALSAEAQALLAGLQPPLASEANGFIDFLALAEPAEVPAYVAGLKHLAAYRNQAKEPLPEMSGVSIDSRVSDCKRGHYLACAAELPVGEILDAHQPFLTRYRALREKPQFTDLIVATSPAEVIPSYQWLVHGNRLSLLAAAARLNAGERDAALAELEAEYTFFRKVAAGSRTLLPKMVAFAMLDATAMSSSEFARTLPPSAGNLWRRLEAITRAPAKSELDVTGPLRVELGQEAAMMMKRRNVRLPDAYYETMRAVGDPKTRPWWDPVAPWLFRPHYSVNQLVAMQEVLLRVVDAPPTTIFAEIDRRRAQAKQLEPGSLERWILSPAGHLLPALADYDPTDYVVRMHGHAATQALVALQVRLRALGAATPEAVAAALAGPLGAAHLNPFTGKPMDFDAQAMTLGFACEEKHLTGAARGLRTAKGKVELLL